MERKKWHVYPAGIAVGLFGAFLLILLLIVVPVCVEQMETAAGGVAPMKCHWMSQSILPFGCLLILLGILLGVSKKWETRLLLLIATMACAVCVLLLATVLVGPCDSLMMRCNYATKPAMQVLSAVLLVCSGLFALNAVKEKGRAK